MIYRSLIIGEYMKLVTERESGVNTFVECDVNGVPTLKARCWQVGSKVGGARPVEQHYIVRKPYDGKLELVSQDNEAMQLSLFQ